MKAKSLLLILVAVLSTLACNARDIYTTDASVLPAPAKQLIAECFPTNGINHIQIDKNLFGVSGYDVVLNNGTELEFNNQGGLVEIECGKNDKVPDALVPDAIRKYIDKTYIQQNVVKLEVTPFGYDVELQSGLDLVFDAQGNFKRIDN